MADGTPAYSNVPVLSTGGYRQTSGHDSDDSDEEEDLKMEKRRTVLTERKSWALLHGQSAVIPNNDVTDEDHERFTRSLRLSKSVHQPQVEEISDTSSRDDSYELPGGAGRQHHFDQSMVSKDPRNTHLLAGNINSSHIALDDMDVSGHNRLSSGGGSINGKKRKGITNESKMKSKRFQKGAK